MIPFTQRLSQPRKVGGLKFITLCASLNLNVELSEILRAARILHNMEKAHASNRGAIGLSLEGGGQEMIDAPMIKQVSDAVSEHAAC